MPRALATLLLFQCPGEGVFYLFHRPVHGAGANARGHALARKLMG